MPTKIWPLITNDRSTLGLWVQNYTAFKDADTGTFHLTPKQALGSSNSISWLCHSKSSKLSLWEKPWLLQVAISLLTIILQGANLFLIADLLWSPTLICNDLSWSVRVNIWSCAAKRSICTCCRRSFVSVNSAWSSCRIISLAFKSSFACFSWIAALLKMDTFLWNHSYSLSNVVSPVI